MKLTTEQTGHHYLAEDGTVLNTKEDKGLWDSLGRTARAAVIYENVRWADFADYFVTYDPDWKVEAIRHPSVTELNSRDHVVIALSCLVDLGHRQIAESLVRCKPRTSTGYTPSQLLFFKAISSHIWSWIYFAYKLPGLAVFIPAWNFFWRVISGTQQTFIHPVHMDWELQGRKPNRWQKFCFKMTMKTFVIFYTVYEIRGIRNQTARKWLLKIIRINIEKHNYVLRALTGQSISSARYDWIPTRSNRWSCRLDITCDRDLTLYPKDTAEDNVEVGMFEYYYQNKEL